MTPSIESVLQRFMDCVRDDAVPALGRDYAGQQLARGLVLMTCVKEELNRGAQWRVQELVSLHQLLSRTVHRVDDDVALRREIDSLARLPDLNEPEAFALDALDQRLHACRRLLTQVHAWSEAGAGRADVQAAIWNELRAGTQRRRLSPARF